jgi:hypothetical protein
MAGNIFFGGVDRPINPNLAIQEDPLCQERLPRVGSTGNQNNHRLFA